MLKIHVREILKDTTDNLWLTLPKEFVLVDDLNKELVTDNKRTIYTSYFWDIIRVYPNITIKVDHHLHNIILNKPFGAGTHRELIQSFYKDIIDTYNLYTPILRDDLNKLIYIVTNNVYNQLSIKLNTYVTSVDILDFIDVVENPAIKESISKLEKNHVSIETAYKSVTDVILKDRTLDNNALAKAMRFNTVASNQVMQCVVARGYNSDVDGVIFPIPITNSYLVGMRTLYDSMVESRLAAKSLLFTKAPLQQTEYFARRLQITNMVLKNIHYCDCGSNKYLNWLVLGEGNLEGSNNKYKGDLPNLLGKYYLDEQTNTLAKINGTEKHLIGKIIKLRSPVAGCMHSDPNGICSTCFGELSQNIQPGANIGHLTSATLNRILSQLVLSVKHVEASANTDGIIIDSEKFNYFTTDEEKDKYYLSEDCVKENYKIEISKDSIIGLSDIVSQENVNYLDISRVTSIREISFIKNDVEKIITISINNRDGILTKEFIDFIRRKGWEINSRNNYLFDMTGWDKCKPIFILPKKQFSNSDHADLVAKTIEGISKDLKYRSVENNLSEILVDIFYKINSRLNINISVIETVMYGFMTVDSLNNDARLPKAFTPRSMGVRGDVYTKRSLAALMALEGVGASIVNPTSFSKLHRQNHPMDVFLTPKETIDSNVNKT